MVLVDETRRPVAAGEIEGDHDVGSFDGVREEERRCARILGGPIEAVAHRPSSFGKRMRSLASESIDERAIANVEHVRKLEALRYGTVEVGVMEQSLQASE